MQRETMVGIAWAVGLFAAMAAVFVYEAATFELDEFHVGWEQVTTEGDVGGTLNAGASAPHSFQIDDSMNITYVEVELSWTDSQGGDDAFTLMVTDPNGTSMQANGNNGRIALRFDGLAVPDQEHIDGVDMDHAKETSLVKAVNATTMFGQWNVQVTLNSAPPVASSGPAGTPNPQSCGVAANPACDGSNTYTVTWRVVQYQATYPTDDEAHTA